jgi:hypothetical protein
VKQCKCNGRLADCAHGLPCPGGPIYSTNGGFCPDCAERYALDATRRFVAALERNGVQVDSVTRREPS